MKIYFLGAPFLKELETDQIRNFLNDSTPTIWVCNSGGPNRNTSTFSDWNWFKENNFTTGVGLDNLEAVSDGRVLYSSNIFLKKTTSETTTAKNLIRKFENLHTKFPNARLVYITVGSPYLYDNVASSVMQLSNADLSVEVIDCRDFIDNNINNFFKVGAVLGKDQPKPHQLKEIPPYDRSGIFFDNPPPTIPVQTYTDKSFTQITDETALSYIGKNVLIAWSGGIDSTTVVAAFIKNNVPFKVSVSSKSESENKELYDYLVSNYDTVFIPDIYNWDNLDKDYTVVTGDCADQLYPGIHHNFVPGGAQFDNVVVLSDFDIQYKPYFDTPVEQKYLFDNVRQSFIEWYSRYFNCEVSESEDMYDNYLLPYIQKFPFQVKHYYQLRWFFRFIFQYQYTSKEQFVKFTKTKNDVKAFFDTDDYQRWAITNLDYNWNNYSTNYNNYKMMHKQYNYDVFKLENLLNQTKYPSFL